MTRSAAFTPYLLVLFAAAFLAACPGSAPIVDEEEVEEEEEQVEEEKPRYPVLLIGMDGFLPEYLSGDYGATPNFDRLIADGVRAESLRPVFPTKTFPNLYSIVTGLYPGNHGIISNTVYDPVRQETLRMFDDESQQQSHWWGGEPIWVTAEKAGLRASTFFWVGSEAEIQGIQPTDWEPYNSAVPHGDRVDQVVAWLSDEDNPSAFATLYFSRTDSMGHSHGTRSAQVASAVQNMDAQLGRLIDGLEDAGIWPEINVLIASDHGMVNLDPQKVIFLDDIINMSDVFVVEFTPVAMLNPRQGRADEVFRRLNEDEAYREHYEVYRREDLPQEFHLDHPRVPEILVVAEMPYTITTRSFFQSNGVLTASHGYSPDYPEMHGFFVGFGPDFLEGVEAPILELVDLYSLMAHLLRLEPAANDGSLERIGSEVLRDF